MRRLLMGMGVIVLALVGAERASFAARSLETQSFPDGDVVELIMFEVDGCTYCHVFRRDVLPAYRLSPRTAEVPIRFVDLNSGVAGIKLDSPVDVVPTAILVRNNLEVGRIAGYAGPDSFFRLIRSMLGGAQ